MAHQAQGELDLGGLPRPLVRVTPAKLAAWIGCPRRYRMAYLDRPAPARGGAWAHNTLGAVVHTALRALFDLAPGRRRPHAAAALVATHWSGEGFADDAQAADYRSRAQDWVARYAEGLHPDLEPIGVERWVSAPTQRIVAEGRVDRIDERDGELVVVDYKTGRHGLTTDDARGSQALALYAFAARRTLRRECRRVELHHLPTGTVAGWEHTEQSLTRHVRRAEEAADEIALATDTLKTGGDPGGLVPARARPSLLVVRLPAALPGGKGQRPRPAAVGAAGAMTALRHGQGAIRGLSGVLAGGLVALAIVVCAAQWLVGTSGRPGPGMATVTGHVVAALAAVALQLAAQRSRGRGAALASWSVLLLAAGVLWFGWWA